MDKYRGIIVVGGTGSGKTYWIKNHLIKYYANQRAIYVYDINNEYGGNGYMMEDDKFMGMVANLKSSLIIFEEATIYVSNKSDFKILRFLLTSKRHTNNKIVLVFHSLQAVPRNLFTLCDLMVLFKTNDVYEIVNKKWGEHVDVVRAFAELKQAPPPFPRRALYLRG